MKISAAAITLFATLALASPAPVAQPNAADGALADAVPIQARDPAPYLEARKKPKKPSRGNSSNSSAAVTVTPNLVLQLGALGLGVMEVVRLWD